MLLLVKYPYMDSVGMREPEIDDLELLERSCSMFVLRYLLHHPRKNKTEIMSTEGRNLTTKNRRIDELLAYNLLEVNLTTKNRRIDELLAYNLLEVEEGYRRETIYSLSDQGRRIAEHLDAISTILDEIRPGMSEEGDVYIDPDADALMNHYRDNPQ